MKKYGLPLEEFVDKKNIFAVVGFSENPGKYGNKIYKELKLESYAVYPVNPRLQEAEGDVCYASLSKLPGIPDVVNIVVPPGVAAGIVKEAVELGIKKIWLQPGSESEEAIEYCKKHNVEVLHNVCIMIERRKIKRGKKCHIK